MTALSGHSPELSPTRSTLVKIQGVQARATVTSPEMDEKMRVTDDVAMNAAEEDVSSVSEGSDFEDDREKRLVERIA